MYSRARVDGSGLGDRAAPGQPILEQLQPQTNVTVGAATLTAAQVLSGWLQRSDPVAGFIDTFPSADSIIAAMTAGGLGPQVGDCFKFVYQNTVAQAMTFAAGTGIVSGVGTLNVAASVTRTYFLTLLSTKPTVVLVGTTTNTTLILSGFTAAQVAQVMPGMGVTGVGIGAAAIVTGVSPDAGTINVSVASTATAGNIAITFNPRIRLDSIGTQAA